MRVTDAVNSAPGLVYGLVVLVAVYAVLTVLTIAILRRMAGSTVTAATTVTP
jgi:cytochrome d ubiquinol oxidase subunit I